MVKLENISLSYFKDKPVISDLSLEVFAGSIHGLLGKNGAGKSSLLKLICGLRNVQKGNIEVLGFKPSERKSKFSASYYFVPEEIYLPSMTASFYIRLYSSYYPNFSREQLEKYISDFDLESNMHLGKCSFGQKKKFLIAFAMATGTPLVLFDEPTNGLDIPSKTVFRRLAASAVTPERCFIISTHQVRDLNLLLDNIILLNKGKILLNSSIADISNKYAFVGVKRNQREDQLIYSEEHIDGIKAIVANEENMETKVDLELLFNAVVLGKINL